MRKIPSLKVTVLNLANFIFFKKFNKNTFKAFPLKGHGSNP